MEKLTLGGWQWWYFDREEDENTGVKRGVGSSAGVPVTWFCASSFRWLHLQVFIKYFTLGLQNVHTDCTSEVIWDVHRVFSWLLFSVPCCSYHASDVWLTSLLYFKLLLLQWESHFFLWLFSSLFSLPLCLVFFSFSALYLDIDF
jgi:hypothetical protein